MFKFTHIFAPICVAACATTAIQPTNPEFVEAEFAARASYDVFPSVLFEATAETCSEPQDTLVRPSANEVRCESLLPPDLTAAAIVEFGGNINNLPKSVFGFVAVPNDQGFIVSAIAYLRVPQENGSANLIALDVETEINELRELFEATNGRAL